MLYNIIIYNLHHHRFYCWFYKSTFTFTHIYTFPIALVFFQNRHNFSVWRILLSSFFNMILLLLNYISITFILLSKCSSFSLIFFEYCQWIQNAKPEGCLSSFSSQYFWGYNSIVFWLHFLYSRSALILIVSLNIICHFLSFTCLFFTTMTSPG